MFKNDSQMTKIDPQSPKSTHVGPKSNSRNQKLTPRGSKGTPKGPNWALVAKIQPSGAKTQLLHRDLKSTPQVTKIYSSRHKINPKKNKNNT